MKFVDDDDDDDICNTHATNFQLFTFIDIQWRRVLTAEVVRAACWPPPWKCAHSAGRPLRLPDPYP